MATCYECEDIFANNLTLLKHYRISHFLSSSFTCSNCFVTFSIFNSFKNHRYIKHSTANYNYDNNEEKSLTNEIIDSKNSQFDIIESDSDSGDSDIFEDEQLDEIQNSLTSNNEICSTSSDHTELQKYVLHFVSKLYNYQEIPRKRIESIVQGIHECCKKGIYAIVAIASLNLL